MSIQSEANLEESMLKQLIDLGYERVKIKDKKDLEKNLKKQIEKFNAKELKETELTNVEFDKLLTHLESGTIFNKAEKLRDHYPLKRDKETIYLRFFNKKDWCKNLFQVSNQITFEKKYSNRYDVTILINGLPLVQIELKRRGQSIKKAFEQIRRYQIHSYHKLFNYIQMFVISNGVNTKYFVNNKEQNFKFTFYWKDKDNKNINRLEQFTDVFLDKCHISKMIAKYMVLNQTTQTLMVLRAYQYYAVEALVNQAINTNNNGYIWHTTGSGKTLTSFKASQILAEEPTIDKIIFVVDRTDLDYQTTKEFNNFAEGSVDGTKNTNSLIKHLKGENKLAVTTIQKLNNAVSNPKTLESVKDKKMILIFDECHRSQFGEMHNRITSYFNNIQYFGFTGTPIFAVNANKHKTTSDLFGKRLHSYVIKDAIADDNVLGFSVEYHKTFKGKTTIIDKEVPGIDTSEVYENEERLKLITDFIIDKHPSITYKKEFNGLFATPSINILKKYYKLFKERIEAKNSDLKVAAIFTFDANEDMDKNEDNKHSRDFLEECMEDYNSYFGSNFTTNDFGNYYVDIAKRFKNNEIDILIVVNMFLTGFDSKLLNTLYVDKNLVYHGLLQAYSRTNRIYNDKKDHGNIICFRNLKKSTDEAITLYSDEDALDKVLMKPYEEYVKDFNVFLVEFRRITQTIDDVDNLKTPNEKAEFITSYNQLLRVLNKLKSFTEFDFKDLNIDEQEIEDYKSKYLDIKDTVKTGDGPESILDDIDFELDLIRQDDINITYIIELMKDLDKDDSSFPNDKIKIVKLMDRTQDLRSKKELIEKFLDNYVPKIDKKKIPEEFELFIDKEREKEFRQIVNDEQADKKLLKEFLCEYEYSGKEKSDLIKESIKGQGLKLKERRSKIKEIIEKVKDFVEKFAF
ncbi:type I restriction endonuclease subunit R [Methanobrevibacter sp. DSM 116169]|uniref:type I restriction endonuclease subunit R n=1 Tax=Methanobrevibacter sp. DSM 116169 TaxID=3242727 RepID=UPI0038FCD26C